MRFRLWRRRQQDDLEEEIQSHLEMAARDRMDNGETAEQSAASARREFGNVGLVKEATRAAWGWMWVEQLGQDLRYALRTLRRSPGFTGVAVLSLGLGIGANTAIFSVIDALILRRLPVRSPEQLVTFDQVFQGRTGNGRTGYEAYQRFLSLTGVFSGLAAVHNTDRYNVTINAGAAPDPAQVQVGVVTGSYFSTLGINATVGRTLRPDDDNAPGGSPVTVISYDYWRRKFAQDPDILKFTLTLNGVTYTVVGVTPREFRGEWVGRPTDFWVPMSMLAQVMTEWPPEVVRGPVVQIVGRLEPGIAISQARAAVQAVYEQLRLEQAGPNPTAQELQFISETRMELEPAANGFSPQRQTLTQPLAILMIVVGLVLLVACANIANLLLARSIARQREMAVRLAIGGGASRIVKQLLVESLVLSAAGGVLGLLLAQGGTNVLAVFAQSGPMRSAQDRLILDVRPSLRVLAFTAGVCLLTGVLFGLAPALRAARVSICASLLSRGASSSPPGQRFGAGKALVVSQIALSLLLLIGSGLFVRTLRNLKSRDLGFDQQHLLMVWLAPGPTRRWGEPMATLYKSMEERISSLPGVRAASPSVYGMLQGNLDPGTYVNVPGYVPQSDADLRAQWSIVGPRYFETLGLERLSGRNFMDQDTAASLQVTILNESMARHFFGSENPLGRHFEAWGVSREIVGVVQDAKYQSPREQGRLMFYLPFRQQLRRLSQTMCLAVRTDGNPAGFSAGIRQELRNIDANLPVLRMETVEDQLNELLAADRLVATLSGFFSGLAVLLACLGLYGVMAYTAAGRTNEIGIRMALGATRGAVMGMLLKESLLLIGTGIAIGLPLTLAATGLVSTRLFGITATDPYTIAGATFLLTAVAALAGFLPARRASRVDPMVALRYE